MNKEQKKQKLIEKLEILDAMDNYKKEHPLEFSERHPKQSLAYKAMQPTRALFWGNRVGKTEWGAMEVARYLLGEHEYRDIKTPVEAWSICPSFDAQAETTQPKLLRYIPEPQIEDTTTIRKGIYSSITLKNGSIINFKSYEQGRAKFQGAGKRIIWFDEEPPHDIWQECLVRQEAGQPLDVILTMTPILGMTWVYDDIYLSGDKGLYYVSTAGWDDNPFLTEEQKDIMARGLTPEAIQVRRYGKFTKRVGLVCNWWDRTIHIRDYPEPPIGTYFEILDGGYSDPASYLLICVDGDDNVHVLDGYREPYLRTEDIKGKRDILVSGLSIRGGWIDSDNPRLRMELSSLGMDLMPVVKTVKGSQASWDQALAEKLAEYGMIQKHNGKPRLYISSSLARFDEKSGRNQNWLMQEIEALMWLELKKDGVSTQRPQWDDHRKFGHHFDGVRALAYFLWSYKRSDKEVQKAIVTPVRDDPYATYPHTPPISFEQGVL